MKIVWDEPKRVRNAAKHGLDFRDLDEDFFAAALILDARSPRLKAVGILIEDVIAVVFAVLGSEGISVISMRRASRQERRLYEQFQSKDPRPH
ncbi:BrnT family toxin [Rhizobium metallidurans]|uniref:BrnT family toxin n=1 Tax=Rhizobium metallidurans TaxID=1265931 RepID=A0A7W6GCR1_9HYPH|nr:BrnT family toxin [Rhizobium metallidurans]MBB3966387.1 hypothetical protein [Rhizobium metallidurans]